MKYRKLPLLLAMPFFLVALCAPALRANNTPAQNDAQPPKPAILNGVGIDQNLSAQIPLSLSFRNEAGQAVHLSDLQNGRPIVLALVYFRCPSLCTAVLNDMLSTLRVIPQDIGSEFDVWTISFDPKETPDLAAAKKAEYLRAYQHTRPRALNAPNGWHFLTGDQSSISALTQAVGYHYRWDDASQQYIHPAGIVILTPDGKISRYFFGVDFDPTDLRLSLVEASGGKIGTFTDKILLFCYHYDPATGKYGLAVINTLRAAGAFTILALLAGFAWLWRIDRRRTRALAHSAEGAGP